MNAMQPSPTHHALFPSDPRPRARRPSGAWLPLALACFLLAASGCHTYQVYRGARVPRPVPSARTGQPMNNLFEAGLTAQTVADFRAPELGDEAAGIHVPRHQGRVELRARAPRTNLDVTLLYEHGLEAGSYALAKGSPTPDGDPSGLGMALYYAVPVQGSAWHIGLGGELIVYGIPFVEYRVCTDGCPAPFVEEDHARVTRTVGSLSVIPSYRPDPNWSFFGGVTMRNHPTVPRTGVEGDLDLGEEVQGGPLNFAIAGGVEYQAASGIRAALSIYQIVSAEPARYYPSVGVSFIIPLQRAPAPRAHPPQPLQPQSQPLQPQPQLQPQPLQPPSVQPIGAPMR